MQLDLDTPFMQARIEDGVGWMMFNNPDRRNAMKLEMNRALVTILGAFAESDDVRVVVMYGAGDKAFVSGADISEFDTCFLSSDYEEGRTAFMEKRAPDFAGR